MEPGAERSYVARNLRWIIPGFDPTVAEPVSVVQLHAETNAGALSQAICMQRTCLSLGPLVVFNSSDVCCSISEEQNLGPRMLQVWRETCIGTMVLLVSGTMPVEKLQAAVL